MFTVTPPQVSWWPPRYWWIRWWSAKYWSGIAGSLRVGSPGWVWLSAGQRANQSASGAGIDVVGTRSACVVPSKTVAARAFELE